MCIQAASESMIMIKGLLKKLIFLQLEIIIETIITIMQTSDTLPTALITLESFVMLCKHVGLRYF